VRGGQTRRTDHAKPFVGFGTVNEPWICAFHKAGAALQRLGTAETVREFIGSRNGDKCLPVPYPLTIARKDFDRLTAVAVSLLSAQTRILRYLLETETADEILTMFDLPLSLSDYVDWDAIVHGRDVIARFDVLPSGSRFWFCELNSDSSLGGSELYDCIAVYAKSLGWPLLRGQHSPAEDVAALLRATASRCHPSRIALCDWSSYRGAGIFDFSLLLDYVRAALPDIDVRLFYEDDYPEEWLSPKAGAETIIYRCFMHEDMNDGGLFYRRLVDSGATIINTFETELRSHKGWLALYFDERYRHLLSPQELEAIDGYVPRTFRLGKESLSDVIAHKDDYVFKLDRATGGAGVLMGSDIPSRELEASLLAQGLRRWVVQRYVEADAVPFSHRESHPPHRIVLGLYLIDGNASGLMVRSSESSKIVNVTSGMSTGTSWCVPTSAEHRRELLAQLERITSSDS
jgi:hypothetical protein